MDTRIEYSAVIDRLTYRAAQRLHMRTHITLIWAGEFALIAYAAWKLLPDWPVGFVLALPFCALFAPLLLWFQRRNLDRAYASSPQFQQAVHMTMTHAGLHYDTPAGEGLVPWGHFVKLRRSRGVMLLYQTPHLFTIVARSFFASEEQWQSAMALAAAEIGRRK